MEIDGATLRVLANVAAEHLANNMYLSLATVDHDGNPWVTPLYYSTTADLNILWVSAVDCNHSNNIQQNARVAISCYDSHAPFGTGQGAYFEARASLVVEDDLPGSCRDFYSRRFRDAETLAKHGKRPADFLPPSPRAMYKAEILRAWVLDPKGHPKYGQLVIGRAEIPLEYLRAAYRPAK
jgi:uncharacterized protein YhbP (UPF0306 family)